MRSNLNNIEQKQEEKYQILKLKSVFNELDNVEVYQNLSNEPPDAFCDVKGKRVAIELTELRWDKDLDGLDKNAQESTASKIMSIAKQKYVALGLRPLQVNVSFNDKYGLTKHASNINLNSSDKERLSSYILEKVLYYYPKSDTATVAIEEYDNKWERILDEKLSCIWISRFPELTENCWVANGSGVIPKISSTKIIERINSKNKNLKKYRMDYDETWLIMLESWTILAGYFHFRNAEDVVDREYEFDFDRAFILRCNENQIIELKKLSGITERTSE